MVVVVNCSLDGLRSIEVTSSLHNKAAITHSCNVVTCLPLKNGGLRKKKQSAG